MPVYIAADETVPDWLRAVANNLAARAARDLGLRPPFPTVRWFSEAAAGCPVLAWSPRMLGCFRFRAPSIVWLKAGMPAWKLRRVLAHEVRHVYQYRLFGANCAPNDVAEPDAWSEWDAWRFAGAEAERRPNRGRRAC